jgi:triose/dihydroxyacetone kinase / FAD-AMP lyase (cyclizing)
VEGGELARKAIISACEAAVAAKQLLNSMDGELGDGDTGSTLSRGAEALLKTLLEHKIDLNDPFEMLHDISAILMDSMGGTSGAIFSIFFQCASDAFVNANEHSMKCWTKAVSLGISGIMRHGKSNVGDRTLLDSLTTGSEAMKRSLRENTQTTVEDLLGTFARGCHDGSEATKNMNPKSGRSSYSLSDKGLDFEFKSHNPDPGAHAIDILSNAIHKAFTTSP